MILQILAVSLGALSVISAFAAAVLWQRSATISTPSQFSIHVVRANGPMGVPLGGNPIGGTYVGHAYSQDLVMLASALQEQSRLSARAARLAGLSAILQAGAVVVQLFSQTQ